MTEPHRDNQLEKLTHLQSPKRSIAKGMQKHRLEAKRLKVVHDDIMNEGHFISS